MQCRSCGESIVKDIISFGNQYLSDFRDDNTKPDQYSLDLVMCGNCSLVQLKETVPQEKMYNERYGYKSGVNSTIKSNLEDVVTKVQQKVTLKRGDVVLDIGANDGTLLNFYPPVVFSVACEPIKKFATLCMESGHTVINDFWNYDAWFNVMVDKKAKVITSISCFYDLENPNQFLDDVCKVLAPNGIFVIQQNYLSSMITQNAVDNIVHEHIEYYSLKSLEHLLKRHDLEIFDVELNDINGGSFRTYIRHINPVDKLRKKEEVMKVNKWGTYFLFGLRIKDIKAKVQRLVADIISKGETIYVYGASTRGNMLLQYFELDNTIIKAAVDRNPEKWGKKIASLGIPIISEEQARKDKPDYMFVCPWFFKEEFLKREKEYLDNGGLFIFPLPSVIIVSKDGEKSV